MEKRLQSCRTASIDKFEVLGFAVNGYGTAQQLIVLRNHVWRYQPDAILLAFLQAMMFGTIQRISTDIRTGPTTN